MAQFKTKRGPANDFGSPANAQVSYDLLPSYRERFTADGLQEIEQVALVAWDDVDNFEAAILPDCRYDQSSYITGQQISLNPYNTNAAIPALPQNSIQTFRGYLARFNPEPHPFASWLYAQEVELIEGAGWPGQDPSQSNGIAFFQQGNTSPIPDGKAFIKVIYRSLPYVFDTDARANTQSSSELIRNVHRNYKPSGHMLVHPTNNTTPYEWVDYAGGNPASPFRGTGGGPAENRLSVPETQTHFIYTWKMVPRVPRQVFEFVGHVNQKEFDIPSLNGAPGRAFNPLYFGWRAFRPGTVVYDFPEISDVYFTITGIPVVDISLHFTMVDRWLRGPFIISANPSTTRFGVGHNFFYRPISRTYNRLIYETPVNNSIPFPTGDDAFPFISATIPLVPVVPDITGGATQYTGNPLNYADLNQLFMLDTDTLTINGNAMVER